MSDVPNLSILHAGFPRPRKKHGGPEGTHPVVAGINGGQGNLARKTVSPECANQFAMREHFEGRFGE
jgi:hypothetical protein